MAKNHGEMLGLEPPYTKEQLRGLKKYKDMQFVIWDPGTSAVFGSDELDVNFNGPNLQFSLPERNDLLKERHPEREISPPHNEEEKEAFKRFREGYFVIWHPDTNTLYGSDEVDIWFNGPNVSFNLPKRKTRGRR